jgi:hypothetical protein
MKEKKRKTKRKLNKRSGGLLPDGTKAWISLFKPNLYVVRLEKSGQSLGWG